METGQRTLFHSYFTDTDTQSLFEAVQAMSRKHHFAASDSSQGNEKLRSMEHYVDFFHSWNTQARFLEEGNAWPLAKSVGGYIGCSAASFAHKFGRW